jgi:hypothetical protein
MEYADDFSYGKITVTYSDIRSSEETPEKRKADFDELITLYQDDKFLLDQVQEGIYVTARNLAENDGKINASFSGKFDELSIDDRALSLQNEERYILLDITPDEKIESNGKILRTERNVLIVWQKSEKVLTFKRTMLNYDDITHSLVDFYRDWKNN